MSIGDEAVEAAVHAYGVDGKAHEWERRMILNILEAAAPYMPSPDAASVWDEAANVLYMGNAINQDHLKIMWERNPYRSQA